jgi:hypothetical protein
MSISDWTGFMSMFFWLGAQFPSVIFLYPIIIFSHHSSSSQLLENFRRQSVEGLALPFLANWLLGTIYTPLAVHCNAKP